MITKENLKTVLAILGFEKDRAQKYTKSFKDLHTSLSVDFDNNKLIYPKELIIHDNTTSNFYKPENFVVFECVCRLLEKGYKSENIELEPKWSLGREAKGGKADILVKDRENKPYLIIECKTSDSKAKKDKFSKEWERMQNDGGQLFSYFQQEKEVKFLCLYTSDLENNNLVGKNYIIQVTDNEDFLKQSKKQGYKDAHSNTELVKIWKETYNREYQENGIFENEIQAYGIQILKPNFENLKAMSQSEIQKKRHEWATILRANAVGDRVLALNKLMNLFLCKITDELENKKDLQFNWNGYTKDTAFDLVDRLQKLYKTGMEKYLNQNITYHSKDSIEQAFSKNFRDIAIKEKIENIFNELKYFSNGDFDFIEVYNESLFNKNFQILLPIVQSLQNIGFTKEADSNILGDYFESYIHDMPQQEGQYFTPVPLVNFIISSLPVLKNAKVLDFACGAGHFLTQYAELNKNYQKAYFLGIDKDQRLAKIAKIASFMHQEEINIYAYDSLQKAQNDDEKHQKAINDNSVNVLISNPPYAVDGFLSTLDEDSRKEYEIFSDTLNIETNNAIECFFIEKAAKALQTNGLLALVLPISLLNKDGIYQSTREFLLKEFELIAICELGNTTFFKTGTNCIVLFALRKSVDSNTRISQNDIFNDFKKLILESKFSTLIEAYTNFLPLLKAYCAFQKYDEKEFQSLLKLKLKEDSMLFEHEIFKEYLNAYKTFITKEKEEYEKKSQNFKDKTPFSPSKSKESFIRELECEKFLYFCYAQSSNPLIIKAPKDNKEQKTFLGYEWSNTKGKQGIVYINADSINDIKTPLYNPKERLDSNKLNFYILQEYFKKLDSNLLDEANINKEEQVITRCDTIKSQQSGNADISPLAQKTCLSNHSQEVFEIPKDLQAFAFKARLIDMIDFSNTKFNKAINLSPSIVLSDHTERSEVSQNPFTNCRYPLVRLGELCDLLNGYAFKSNEYTDTGITLIRIRDIVDNVVKTENSVKVLQNDKYNNFKVEYGDLLIALSGATTGKMGIYKEKSYSYLNQRIGNLKVKNKNKFLPQFRNIVLSCLQNAIYDKAHGSAQPNISTITIENFKIPLPPLEIQKQIVEECQKVEEQYNTIRMSIEEYQKLIKAVLIKCAISESSPSTLSSLRGNPATTSSQDEATLTSLRGSETTEAIHNIDFIIQSLIESIQSLESKLDFELLQSLDSLCQTESALDEECHGKESKETDSAILSSQDDSATTSLRGSSDSYNKSFHKVKNTDCHDSPQESRNDEITDYHDSNMHNLAITKLDSTKLNTLLESLPTPPQEGWEKIRLDNKKYLSLNPSKAELANLDENTLVSFVEMASVSDKGFIQNRVDKSLKELKKGGYTYFKENDILIAKITPCMENGKCAIAKNLTNGLGMGSTEFHIFRAKEDLNNKFLFLCLNQDFIRQKAERNMTGSSGHRRVPISFYESLQIPLPPLKVQEKIVSVIESIESRIILMEAKLPYLADKKQAILSNSLSKDK